MRSFDLRDDFRSRHGCITSLPGSPTNFYKVRSEQCFCCQPFRRTKQRITATSPWGNKDDIVHSGHAGFEEVSLPTCVPQRYPREISGSRRKGQVSAAALFRRLLTFCSLDQSFAAAFFRFRLAAGLFPVAVTPPVEPSRDFYMPLRPA